MNRYKKLFSNTLIFGIGTFASKLLVFLLMPIYTAVLSEGEFGIADIVVQTANLLIPLVFDRNHQRHYSLWFRCCSG